MVFQIKQVSHHGTANPIVARLSIQTNDLIQFCRIDKTKRDEVLALYHDKVQRRLLECDDIAQEISKEILEIARNLEEEGFAIQSQGRVIEVPQIIRLEQRVEQFLYCAKSALRDLAKIFGVFFDKEFSEARYDKVYAWAKKQFGDDSELTKIIKQDHDLWIKQVVNMRNAVEHPGGHPGHLHIYNFELLPESHPEYPKIEEPLWHLNNEPKFSIAKDLLTFVSSILELSEDLLVICMKMTDLPEMFQVVEIPEEERKPECAIRLRVMPED